MGKRQRQRPVPGSFFKSLPSSVQSEFGIANASPTYKAAVSSTPRRVSADTDSKDLFISTQPPDDQLLASPVTSPNGHRTAATDSLASVPDNVGPVPNGGDYLQAEEEEDDSSRPKKRRKLDSKRSPGLLGPGMHHWDATGLVPHYKRKGDFPPDLQKWYPRRRSLFSLYDKGCLLDDVGWYSVTPEKVADQIAERCRCDTILDAFCGVGGNAIAFARTCERVIAIDNSPVRLALARHNAAIYGVQDRIDFILADYPSFVRAYSSLPGLQRKIDAVFLSPPWGGPAYIAGDPTASSEYTHPIYHLNSITPLSGQELFHLTRTITRNVAYYLPKNVKLEEVSALLHGGSEDEMVEIEEEWMGTRLTALTCYFGGLASGQEKLFDT